MSLLTSFEQCVRKILSNINLEFIKVEINWGHVVLFYAKCGIILSEEDFLGSSKSRYLNFILEELKNPQFITDYVSFVKPLEIIMVFLFKPHPRTMFHYLLAYQCF